MSDIIGYIEKDTDGTITFYNYKEYIVYYDYGSNELGVVINKDLYSNMITKVRKISEIYDEMINNIHDDEIYTALDDEYELLKDSLLESLIDHINNNDILTLSLYHFVSYN